MKVLNTNYKLFVDAESDGWVTITQDDHTGNGPATICIDKAIVPMLVAALQAAAKDAGE